MRHLAVERWSRGSSAIHRIDPRAKAGSLLIFLVVVATAHKSLPALFAALVGLLVIAIRAAGLPIGKLMLRAAAVYLFTLTVAVVTWLSGDPGRAVALVLKSYLSALGVTLVIATTPLPGLLRGLERCGAPSLLLRIVHLIYRYLFVVSGEAKSMTIAAAARGGRIGFRGAASGVAVLFARSQNRAMEIHHAMQARGFGAGFASLDPPRFRARDAVYLLGMSIAPIAIRAAIERAA